MLVPGMYSEEGRGGSSWLSHCGGHLRQRHLKQEVPPLVIWGNGGGVSFGVCANCRGSQGP